MPDHDQLNIDLLSPPVAISSVPEALLRHAAIRGRYYFFLPEDLLDLLVADLGRSAFDKVQLDLDYALAQAFEGTDVAGLRWGDAVRYPWLSDRVYASK